ncbi:hypothetical protein B0O99DRAFT_606793 [Bisporella sp. PMI_857]|nr:hypothetical protein B0O99DRAFT_606793 [Bisporella sp. PMI_857]
MNALLSVRDALHPYVPGDTPRAGKVISAILSMFTIVVLALLLTRRINATKNWKKVPLTRWITFAVYVDSIIFITASTILDRGYGLNTNAQICDASILLCLTCYLTTKALLFYFLVEKVFVIQKVRKSRLKSKLYLFNCFGLILPYCGVIILNFVYRIAIINTDGTCIIGMQVRSTMPLIILDAAINFYLTMLFVMPLRKLYSYQNTPNSTLRTITLRSFIGSLATLTSSVVNLTVLMVLKGEAAWICLMLCNADILFSVVVLHWVTSKDTSMGSSSSSSHNTNPQTATQLSTLPGKPTNKSQFDNSFGEKYTEGTVTTHISASRDEGLSEEEDNIGMGKIRVQIGQRVEMERGSSSSSGQTRRPSSSRSSADLVIKPA